ncbi:MAG: glycosyltransferase family A protein [Verrucomicrobiota bacterium]
MSALPSAVSVVMRSYNEAWAIGETLAALREQDFPGETELLVIDSGSSDGSPEIIESFAPARFHQIPKGTYVPGVVLNWGMRQARHEWVVFLNADATPANPQWLRELLQAGANCPQLGAVFGRQIPREDCWGVHAHDYQRCFGPERESHEWDHFFSMVSCATTRSIWQEHPIREDLQYAEDDEWSRRMKAAGREIVFAEKSIAIHSHNYTAPQAYQRAFGDMLAVSQAGNVPPGTLRFVGTVLKGTLADLARDWKYFQNTGQPAAITRSLPIRLAQRYGRWKANHSPLAA